MFLTAADVHLSPRIGSESFQRHQDPRSPIANARLPHRDRCARPTPRQSRRAGPRRWPRPQRFAQVDALIGVKAEKHRAVGGDASPVAVPAERRRGRGDHADDEPVRRTGIALPARGGSSSRGTGFGASKALLERGDDFVARHDGVASPAAWRRRRPCIRCTGARCPRSRANSAIVHDFVVVVAAHHHAY